MSKKRALFAGTLCGGLAAAVFGFQNCAPPSGPQAGSAEFASAIEIVEEPGIDHPIPEKTKTETTYEPLLADRHYLRSVLEDVFGPSMTRADTTRLAANAVDQGAACSLYDEYSIVNANGDLVPADALNRCTLAAAAFTSAPLNPKPTVTRQALLRRACSDLVTNNTTFNHAVAKIASGVPQPTEANLRKLFHLFYRAHPEPPIGLIESLQMMFPTNGMNKDDWRSVIFTVCASSYWQIL